jgi:hypothetical protein
MYGTSHLVFPVFFVCTLFIAFGLSKQRAMEDAWAVIDEHLDSAMVYNATVGRRVCRNCGSRGIQRGNTVSRGRIETKYRPLNTSN